MIWYDTPITKIEEMTPGVRRFWIANPGITFTAGQFLTFDLPIGEKRLQRWRSYSIASSPSQSKEDIELCIVRSAEGLGTQYLFESAQVGTTLRWKGPDGTFTLPDAAERDIVMICTGTGLAPFRSMLQEVAAHDVPHRRLHLIFGTRTEQDILYRAELEALQDKIEGFTYDIVLSRAAAWKGHTGHVHPVYMEAYREVRPDVLFMLCGWSRMIDDAVANLIVHLGYDRKQVLYELYG